MKAKAVLSAIMGLFFGFTTYFVLRYIEESDAFLFAVIGGLFFYLVLFVFLIMHEKTMDKKYAEFEKKILSPVFHKTNGNFKLHNGKIKNANIYFCEDGIALISLDEKPYIMEEIKRSNIYRIQCDDIHFNINTSDGKFYIITLPDAKVVFQKLKEKDWIIQI
ncbi:MAG: hypothetical protein Q4B04_05545 [bacterium]|nr:hypothetical protein [bacterium]